MNPEEIKAMVAELRKANEALEAGKGSAAEHTAKIAVLEAKLDANETENQKLVKSLAEKDKAQTELSERVSAAEKTLKRFPGGSPEASEAKAEMKTFEKYMIKGITALSPEEVKLMQPANFANSELKTMQTGVDPDGGYLAPYEYVLEILKKITLISPIRQYARVRKVAAPGARTFRRDTLVTSYWTAEAADFTPSQSVYGQPEIPLHSLTGEVAITTFNLFGSAFNLDAEISSDLVEEFNRLESKTFVDGNGKSKPSGFTLNGDIEVVNSGVANGIVFDNFHSLYGKIKTGYKPVYGMNRLTVSVVRKMKNAVGDYLWQQGNIVAGIPNMINGEPYVEIPHMPDIAANALPVVYGDFSKGYQIVDGLSMNILRNPYRKSGYVYFVAERFVGGQVVLPEALKLLKCSL